jgi:predicted MFS family arabinose efflux permease
LFSRISLAVYISLMRNNADIDGHAGSPQSGALAAAFGGLIALAAAMGVGRFVYTPILPPMVEALGLSGSVAGLIASANFLGYLVGALAAAAPILPGPRRFWLIGALALSAITTGGMGLTQSLTLFLLLRFVGGLASAFVLILASAVVLERVAAAGHASLASLHFSGVGVGIAVSAIMVAVLLQAGASWRSLWLASGALSVAAAFAAAVLLRDGRAPPRVASDDAGRPTGRGLTRLIVAYGLFGFGYVITATFLVAIVRGTPMIRSLEPVIWVMFGLAAAPSVAFWTLIATRRGIPAAFALACVVEAAGVAASVVWPSEIGIILAAILVGGTFMGLTALGLERARSLASGDPRRVLALMTSAFGLGQIVGPAFAGAVSDWLGGFTAPSMAAMLALVAAAALAGW